ncbi:caldesmon [Sarotherodon galilaeus]
MRGVGRGRNRGTRKNPLADMEEREGGQTIEPDPPPEGAMADEDDFEPVVRPKHTAVGVVSKELSEPDIFDEIREFMRHSRRTEAILFEQIKQLSDNIPRLQHDVHSELQPSVQSDISTAAVFPKQETGQLPPLSALQPPHGVAEHQAELPPPSQPLHAQPQMHVVQPAPVQRAEMHHGAKPRIPDFREGEDPESFFVRFERIAKTWGWPQVEWAARVVTLLTGKALEAYAGMDEEQSDSYDAIKAAVLSKFNVTEETYRYRFRSTSVPVGESVRETYNRIKGLYKRWMHPDSRSKEEIGETIILEQFLRVLQPDVRTWVKEHNPKTGGEAADLAERYLAAHREPSKSKMTVGRPRFGEVKPPGVASVESLDTRGGKKPIHCSQRYNLICYYCQQPGHKASLCPLRKPKSVELCVVPSTGLEGELTGDGLVPHKHVVDVSINGQTVKALADTGSSQTLVKSSMLSNVLPDFNKPVNITCVHGCQKDYPTADVTIEVEGQAFMLTVGVLDQLAYDVILGEDLPILDSLVRNNSEAYSCAVVTRSMKRGLEPLPDVDEDLFEGGSKIRKTKQQRRQEKNKNSGRAKLPEPTLPMSPPIDLQWEFPNNFRERQENDPSLQPLFKKACNVDDGKENAVGLKRVTGEPFIIKDNLLYLADMEKPRLVVPKEYRSVILHLGHTVPWSGHLGQAKTYNRVAQRFYWPGLYKDVVDYCKTCHECQKVAPTKLSDRAQLQTLPIMDVPYERIAMDIIGPLPKSSNGHKYALVICDYATRYPDVYPLRSLQVKHIVRCLVDLFSRVGIPKEILTDQGTSFMSHLVKSLYDQLGVKGIRTTPYHPETDGLVERFNGTLKQMLRKFIDDTGKDWDKWLPFLLFAYREVPQASTGFSPFELLYGRQVRGPLDMLKENWVAGVAPGSTEVASTTNIVSYILQMRDKLETYREKVRDHMQKAQQKQKVWYDKHACERELKTGQKVLVLLPTGPSKLLAKWQGPYTVARKTGPVTYEVICPDRHKSKQLLHVNLLKEYHERNAPEPGVKRILMVRDVQPEDSGISEVGEVEMSPFRDMPKSEDPPEHLTEDQWHQLNEVRQSFPSLYSDKPGRTDAITHNIILKDTKPVRLKPYRIPERMMGPLRKEVQMMLELGVIEPSKSEWSNPIVLVPKKDSPQLRFCSDMRKLNSISCFDSYPMPRIDELLERLGKAKYITTLDLCKGYWQVPLEPSCKEYTAFQIPGMGLFQYTVLPFGLHGAPATFQRLMDIILDGCFKFAAAYLDDVVIYSESWEEHLQHLKVVMAKIQKAGLTLNVSKCAWAQEEVKYLGYIVGHGQIKPQVEKVKAIQTIPRPKTKKQVRSFLGLVGWFRRFIPHFSTLAAPLTDLTRKHTSKVMWNDDCEHAFQSLKRQISEAPVLQSPDFSKPFVVQVDASNVGLGAVLAQGEAGEEKPVLFLSKKLFDREKNYSTVEKEGLAIKWAIDSLKYYLLGREFR